LNLHTFSILNVGQIQYFFKVLKNDFTIQYFLKAFNIVWEYRFQYRVLISKHLIIGVARGAQGPCPQIFRISNKSCRK